MRFQVLAIVLALALSAAPGAQEPRFRSGVDLITVEVSAIDSQGRPVEDLQPRDFTVKVDGKGRDVVSAQLVRVDRERPVNVETSPVDALISTNEPVPGARRVVVGVDQTLIVPGAIVPLLQTAGRFVESLTPQDYAALVTFPEPGPRVDFTTDKTRVREGLTKIVGQPAKQGAREFHMSPSEASAVQDKERVFAVTMGTPDVIWRSLGPYMRRVFERGACEELTIEQLMQNENAERFGRCVQRMIDEAGVQTLDMRQEANFSLRRLESLLTELVPIDGSKSLVLISAGLLIEDLSILDEVVRLAALSRTSIHVIAVDTERDKFDTIVGLPNAQSSTELEDRQLQLSGLETIADRTGGAFIRSRAGNGQGIFDRLSTELSAWYVVAVERKPGDGQRIQVDVRRKGVTVRSRSRLAPPVETARTRNPDELLREAMGSSIPISGVPLRVSTFATRDTSTNKVRLHLAADIGTRDAPAGDYTVGYVVTNPSGNVVGSFAKHVTRPPGATGLLPFETALLIDPGAYAIRLGAVDPEGHRGTAVRDVDLTTIEGERLQTSDLIIGSVPPEGEALHPLVEPHITDAQLAGYVELYVPDTQTGPFTAALEVAEGENAPSLTTRMLNIAPGARPAWLVASGKVETDLLPGRYVARVTVRRREETLRVLSRPFVLEASTVPRRVEGPARGAPISPDLQRRTASYVGTLVHNLANVVAQEDFKLSKPDRHVTSDFLLVQYPGSDRDLLTFRDVMQVNGTPLPGHDQQLVELFVKPLDVIRDRVRQITSAGESQVPTDLNPMFVLAFLQADFQSRFTITVNRAGSEWPPQVRAVTFVETARPTLLRTGLRGEIDVPTHGTAWVEEATGRILQSELEIGSGRSATKITTRFTLDERLQIMVPSLMRTENPSGVATYGNFRRFRVTTATETEADKH